MIALDLSTSMEAGDFRPQQPHQRGQGDAERGHLLAGQRPHRPGGVRRRGLHPGAAHARLRRAPRGGEAAAHPRARGRHRHRRRAGGVASTGSATRTPRARWWCSSPTATTTPAASRPSTRRRWRRRCTSRCSPSWWGRAARCRSPTGRTSSATPATGSWTSPSIPALLQQISKMTGGEYYRATDRESLRAGLQRRSSTGWTRASSSRAGRAPTTARSSRPSCSRRSSARRWSCSSASTVLRVFP